MVDHVTGVHAGGCCTGNATQALYYAWDSIIRCNNGVAQVNLLLNRVSPWMDIASYLPYEGKVVLKNKKAEVASVRIPRWVNKSKVKVERSSRASKLMWTGNNLLLTSLKFNDVITISFPVQERTEKAVLTANNTEYTFSFRGNTVVDIQPRTELTGPVYPTYQRDLLKSDTAPMKTKTCFVSDVMIPW